MDLLGIALTMCLVFFSFCLFCTFLGRKRQNGEPPLITGWIPYVGKTLEFCKNPYKFLNAQKEKYGDIFTVYVAGKYITFIMDPTLYPSVIKHRKQLDFRDFSDQVAPVTFGYPPIRNPKFPGIDEHIHRGYQLLQGDNLSPLTENMMKNLLFLFRQDYLSKEPQWRTEKMYSFCSKIMFEATFMTVFGKSGHTSRHADMASFREKFDKFDAMFPLLIAGIPIKFLGATKKIREDLINIFLPERMAHWKESSEFVKVRAELFEQYELLGSVDKAAHHFSILWASVGNTIPATFWAMYYLVRHPQALAAVRDEILCALQLTGEESGRGQDIILTREQLDSLLYLGSAINESLRLSSASMNIRIAQEDFFLELDKDWSVGVRKGDIIALYPQSMHMDPEIFEDPEIYKFDRFVEGGKEKTNFYKHGQKLKYYWMPFGSGATKCPGRYLAVNEIKQFLSLLLLFFEIEEVPGEAQVKLDNSRAGLGILLPDSDIHFCYRVRNC
ncbi:cytochrome P450 7B1 isoform X1 [Lepisosteus oculatus]|uniref:cytochrome P450 7B1 isoform X1 n=1 Tax=Lepisosteus oculatus TaxID=7918 RepID=UPI0007404CF9|nr:PREDICTED: 25-hydroxycholesterol 7-alpha-hydroxylase isoform X1 [Lepisosteus oculatus]XP_015209274.1 PREDICTED: 25-hydroxycholesterol 7-alpha-hydroxylase isoform X1 [Lepisosteus oculatus]